MNLHTQPDNFIEFITRTAEATKIYPLFIEKDYWLTTVLLELSQSPHRDITVFKGGTSLSKAYGIIERFSEDVDLALIAQPELNNNKIKNQITAISKSISHHLSEIEVKGITSKGSRFRRTAHSYPLQTEQLAIPHQVSPELILEINAFANPYPCEIVEIESLIATYLKQSGREDLIQNFDLGSFKIQVLRPERTLAEKVLALARASYDPEPVLQLQNKIRHAYDLYQLLQHEDLQTFVSGEEFLKTLQQVQADDAKNSEFQGEWASKPLSEALIYRENSPVWVELEPTYQGAFKNLVYGSLPNFKDVQQCIQKLGLRLKDYDLKNRG
ncbi:MAG: nucleotidyl transferase AbiEii/AbiGii toxin family protein [Bacteriovoracia bacterium]